MRIAIGADHRGFELKEQIKRQLALGAWPSSDVLRVIEIVETFLATPFEGGRHASRVDKIRAYEAGKGRS